MDENVRRLLDGLPEDVVAIDRLTWPHWATQVFVGQRSIGVYATDAPTSACAREWITLVARMVEECDDTDVSMAEPVRLAGSPSESDGYYVIPDDTHESWVDAFCALA